MTELNGALVTGLERTIAMEALMPRHENILDDTALKSMLIYRLVTAH